MRKAQSYFEFIDETVRNKPVILTGAIGARYVGLTLSNWIYIEEDLGD